MHPNEVILNEFYATLQKKNHQGLKKFYASDAVFSDPMYLNLRTEEIHAMWELFCINSKNFSLEFGNVKADDQQGEVSWKASYIYASSGNSVTKEVKSSFEFKEGKIVRQNDVYDFHEWAGQALGLMGSLLGWTGFVENQVKENARKNLEAFMSDEL
ncbi:MAG: nuclear transport factor 2 family protein [Cytophagaceae bacterium]|jgi:hypothetical protein|nr:nuclear transport factor 2 family protein [Cytophagaceae bacterium]